MVGIGEENAGDVRDGQADESDRAAESGDRTGQQGGGEEDQLPRTADVESHRAGVVFAQQEQVQRFDDRDGQHESENDGRKQQTELSERNVAERSHRPDDERFEGGFVAQVLQDLHDGSDTRRKHHAQDENDHDVFDSAADRSDQHQDQRRADPGSARNAEGGD